MFDKTLLVLYDWHLLVYFCSRLKISKYLKLYVNLYVLPTVYCKHYKVN